MNDIMKAQTNGTPKNVGFPAKEALASDVPVKAQPPEIREALVKAATTRCTETTKPGELRPFKGAHAGENAKAIIGPRAKAEKQALEECSKMWRTRPSRQKALPENVPAPASTSKHQTIPKKGENPKGGIPKEGEAESSKFRVHYLSGKAFVNEKEVRHVNMNGSAHSWEFPEEVAESFWTKGSGEPRCPSCDTPQGKAKHKFCHECGYKLDDTMGQPSKAKENLEYCKEAALKAQKALKEAKQTLQQQDGDDSSDEDTIELEWELVKRGLDKQAVDEDAKHVESGQSKLKPKLLPRPKPNGKVAISVNEVCRLLPYLSKDDKKTLQKQLNVWAHQQPKGYPPNISGRFNRHPASHVLPPDTAAPTSRKPNKQQLRTMLDNWRRDLYVEKIDKDGKLCISTCAHTSFGTQQNAKPTAQQRSCPHPFESLVWGANGSAHYARCDRCKMKHVIYYDVHAQEVLVGQGENIARPRPSSTPSRRPVAAEESSAAEADADATGTSTRTQKCADRKSVV